MACKGRCGGNRGNPPRSFSGGTSVAAEPERKQTITMVVDAPREDVLDIAQAMKAAALQFPSASVRVLSWQDDARCPQNAPGRTEAQPMDQEPPQGS